jgi:hypothetical protein
MGERPPAYGRFLSVLVFLLYALALAVVTCYHEPGTDEADAWLAARDLSVRQVFDYTRQVANGNPATLYLLRMPLAKLGMPYASMLWAHYAIAMLAAAVFLAYAPFPRFTKALILFSYYLGYQYPVIARNYALLTLLLWTTAALYEQRMHRPVLYAVSVFFLYSTTAHGAFFAAVVTGAFAFELLLRRQWDKRKIIALAIMFAGAGAIAVQLWPPTGSYTPGVFEVLHPKVLLPTLTRAVVVPFGSELLDPIWLVFNLVVLFAALFYLLRRPISLLMFLVGIASLFYIFVCKWCIPYRHAGLIFLWLIFILWVSQSEPVSARLIKSAHWLLHFDQRRLLRLLNYALFASCIQATMAWDSEIRIEYSHGLQMAKVISARRWDQTPIASTFVAEAVLPYLRCREFYSLHSRRYLSCNTWDDEFAVNAFLTNGKVWERIHEIAAREPRIQVLWNWSLPRPEANGYRLAYKTTGPVGATEEVFYFYIPINPTTQPATRE